MVNLYVCIYGTYVRMYFCQHRKNIEQLLFLYCFHNNTTFYKKYCYLFCNDFYEVLMKKCLLFCLVGNFDSFIVPLFRVIFTRPQRYTKLVMDGWLVIEMLAVTCGSHDFNLHYVFYN